MCKYIHTYTYIYVLIYDMYIYITYIVIQYSARQPQITSWLYPITCEYPQYGWYYTSVFVTQPP